MDWYLYAGAIAIGLLAGFINTLAGSGSLLTLPFLMFLGLPANVANGTNRIAILLQNVVGVASFKQQKVLKIKHGLILGVPSVIGAAAGALLAVKMDEIIMQRVIGGLLVFMFFLVLLKPSAWLKGKTGQISEKPTILNTAVFFLIGMYGGFIQAGVGFFLLAGLVLGVGFDLVKANAIKVFIVLLYTPLALVIFIFNNQVNYKLGLILAVGNMLGAFIGSKVAVSWGAVFVRYVLLIAIIGSALKLLGVFDRIFFILIKSL